MTKKDFASPSIAESKNYISLVVILLFLFALVIAFFIFDFRNKKITAFNTANDQQTGAVADQLQPANAINQQMVDVSSDNNSINDLIKKLGKHIFLPTGKVTVTTVIDAEALRKSSPIFYQYAKKGDRVVIYPTEAILYDPVIDLVLDVAHFSAQPVK